MAGLPLGNQTDMSMAMIIDDDRMIIHCMLYRDPDHAIGSQDNNNNLKNHSKTDATANYLTSNAGKNSVTSKQGSPMNRIATSENCISAVKKMTADSFTLAASILLLVFIKFLQSDEAGSGYAWSGLFQQ